MWNWIGDTQRLRLYLLAKAPADNTDMDGRTPLHHAAIDDCGQCAKILLRLGHADPYLRDRHGKTAIDIAVEKNSNVLEIFNLENIAIPDPNDLML